jgi:putative sterol carrier protein
MADLGTKEQLEKLFAAMASYLQGDEQFRSRVAQSDVSVGFVLPELDGDVALRFLRGDISASPGGSAEARVAVTLSAATLEKMLSGQLDPESAYMCGSLSLRGSEYEAEGLLGYWHSIVAAYKASTGA